MSSILAGFGSLDTKITPQAPYISQGAPTPQQCRYGARPMVLCTRSLGKKCHPSVDTLVPDTVNTDAKIDKIPTSLRPMPPPPLQPVPMVPPSWPCLLCPHEKLTVQAIRATSKR